MWETLVARQALVQAAGDAIMVAAVHGRLGLWNPAAARLVGFTAAKAVGSALDRIIPERFRARDGGSGCHTDRADALGHPGAAGASPPQGQPASLDGLDGGPAPRGGRSPHEDRGHRAG
jgi:PAS domain-containing protein